MFKLFKATTIVSVATLSSIAAGIIRAKFNALQLGPAGVGIFSQAFQFQQLLVTIASLTMQLGLTKYVAQYTAEKDDRNVEGVVASAAWMQVGVSLVLVTGVAIAAPFLSQLLFAQGGYGGFLIVLTIGVPFAAVALTLEAVFFGIGKYSGFAKGRSLSVLLGLIPLFVFVGTMKVKGGFIYLGLSGILTFSIYCWLWRRDLPDGLRRRLVRAFFAFGTVRETLARYGKGLVSYGVTAFLSGLASMFTIVGLRSLVIRWYGAEENGFYQAVFALSSYYLAFFTNGLWSYFFPKMSGMKSGRAYAVELNHTMRFCVFGVIPFIAGLFLLKGVIIRVLFSDQFMYATQLFATQLAGDLFFILRYILATSLLASARLKRYLFFEFFQHLFFFGLGALLLGTRAASVKGITIAYLASNLCTFAILLWYHVRAMRVRIYGRNVTLFASALALVAAVLFLGGPTVASFFWKAALVAAWFMLVSTRSEKKRFTAAVDWRLKGAFGRHG